MGSWVGERRKPPTPKRGEWISLWPRRAWRRLGKSCKLGGWGTQPSPTELGFLWRGCAACAEGRSSRHWLSWRHWLRRRGCHLPSGLRQWSGGRSGPRWRLRVTHGISVWLNWRRKWRMPLQRSSARWACCAICGSAFCLL